MKWLIIGDLHAQVSNLEDTKRLFGVWLELIRERNISHVVFLGDVYHTHAVLRQEVLYEVKCGIDRISSLVGKNNVFVLAGNHDGVSPHSVAINAVRLTLENVCRVVDDCDELVQNDVGLAFLPYIYEPSSFIAKSNELYKSLQYKGAKYTVLFCHQPFHGATYENGFDCDEPAPHPSDILFDKVISGHIHMEQTIGKIYYIGTPRQVSISEANQIKSVGIMNLSVSPNIELVSMNGYVSNYYDIELVEQDLNDLNGALSDRLNKIQFKDDLDVLRVKLYSSSRDDLDKIKTFVAKILPSRAKVRYLHIPNAHHKFYGEELRGMRELNWKEMFTDYIERYSKVPLELRTAVLNKGWEIWEKNKKI